MVKKLIIKIIDDKENNKKVCINYITLKNFICDLFNLSKIKVAFSFLIEIN